MDKNDLFQRYLDICNQALDANKERFPFKQILGAAREAEQSRQIEVRIVDDEPADTMVMTIKRDAIQAEDHASCADCNCDGEWRVSKSYLESVVENPQAYIENPAKIDWDWMYAARD